MSSMMSIPSYFVPSLVPIVAMLAYPFKRRTNDTYNHTLFINFDEACLELHPVLRLFKL